MSVLKSLFILVAMFVAFYLGGSLKPSYIEVGNHTDVQLEKIIPLQFLDWKVDNTLPIVLGDPEQEALLNSLYSQQVSRTYVDLNGNRVMLSIAYGDIQNKSSQVHFPEVCYPAQGFVLLSQREREIRIDNIDISVKEIDTKLGARNEAVTYWIRMGDKVILSRFEQKINTIIYGLEGKVVDGLLFRVSTINLENNYEVQHKFIKDLLNSISIEDQSFLLGSSIYEKQE